MPDDQSGKLKDASLPRSRTESPLDHNYLALDEQTLKDLEIFETGSDEPGLFQYCNLTETLGGSRALRRRMENPWSDPEDILATQQAVSFVVANRNAFTDMPTAFVTARVNNYCNEILPIVVQTNPIEFALNAFSLWAHHDRHYASISRGVFFTCGLIRKLRRFINQPGLESVTGEMTLLIAEMRRLLNDTALKQVPGKEIGGWFWRLLQLDQLFRIEEKQAVFRLLTIVYEIDALVAMSDVTRQRNFVIPEIAAGPLAVEAEGLVHPFVNQPVANPVNLNQQRRVLFLTGPNMAGKTTYIKSFATAYYLAHLGMGVPATRFKFVPAEILFSSISLTDDLRGGISYFRAEALRVKDVAQAVAAGKRVVALMDEPFKGTNVKDAYDASLAILERFSTKQDCLFLFSSHLIELSEQIRTTSQIDCHYFEAEASVGRLQFDYVLRPGVSSQRLGMRVLEEEGVFDLLDGKLESTPIDKPIK